MDRSVDDELPIGLRVWTSRKVSDPEDPPAKKPQHRKKRVARRYPNEALVFDTETAPGLDQKVWFLVWRLYRDRPDSPRGHFCVEEGIAYADDLPETDPEGYRVLCEYVQSAEADISPGLGRRGEGGRLVFKSISWWLQERLFRYGYQHRDRCQVVGFNLPFDLGGLAKNFGEARGRFRGGWSLSFWGSRDGRGVFRDLRFHPRLRFRAMDPRRTLFSWGVIKNGDDDGKGGGGMFVDLRTLTFALTDRSHTLEGACAAFGDPFKKADVRYDEITPELLTYARADVEHTAVLYRNTAAELDRHLGIDLQANRLYSPAGVGSQYMTGMGLVPPLEKFTELSEKQLGWTGRLDRELAGSPIDESILGFAMCGFYGGRAEARLIRVPVPVVHVDFTSMYPAINSLLGTWSLIRAASLRVADVTEEVRKFLARPDLLERMFEPEVWSKDIGITFVEVKPDGDILPVRAAYDPDSNDFGIGLNPLHYDGRLWYAMPDVVEAAILNPAKTPRVIRALRLDPVGIQEGLKPVRLRGDSDLALDPAGNRDPFLTMIEERARVRNDQSLGEEERERIQLFLKITANSTAYGSLARFDPRNDAKASEVVVRGPGDEPKEWSTKTPEDPGPYCFPPVAASITAGARLMLALLERLVGDAGGTYAMCDTDSMAIVAARDEHELDCPTPDGSNRIKALSAATVRESLDRFGELNPYDPGLLQPWKVEHDSLEKQLYCYAISAKRYCLFRYDDHGEVVLVDWSEHGLGAYADPSGRSPEEERDEKGRRIWMREVWEWAVANALGKPTEMPEWAQRAALTIFTISSPRMASWFGTEAGEQVRPGSFGMFAHPDRAFYELSGAVDRTPLPAAPLESDPTKWPDITWRDRRTAESVEVVTAADLRSDPDLIGQVAAGGAVVIEAMGRVLARFILRPEHKSLAPEGGLAGSETVGLLGRRPVTSRPWASHLIGKEGNLLMERIEGHAFEVGEYRNDYGTVRDPWDDCELPALRRLGAAEVVRRTGLSRSAVYAVLAGAKPRVRNRKVYERSVPPGDAPASRALDDDEGIEESEATCP